MVDFKKYLTPETLQRMTYYDEKVAEHKVMSLEEFIAAAEHCMVNCIPPKRPKGEPVYDSTMWHVIIPEMLRRLKTYLKDEEQHEQKT
jgi:hypothetical protein